MIHIIYFCKFEFRNEKNLDVKIDSLAKEIMSQVGNEWMTEIGQKQPQVAEKRPAALQNKVSRAFKHSITGEFLAESGESYLCENLGMFFPRI